MTRDEGQRKRGASVAERRFATRRALKFSAAVPVAAALGAPQTALARGGAVAGADAASAGRRRSSSPRTSGRRCAMLVDYIIPRDERSGSATDAKVPEYMDFLLAEKDANVNNADRDARRTRAGSTPSATSASRRRSSRRPTRSGAQVLDDIAYPQKAKPEMSHGVDVLQSLPRHDRVGLLLERDGLEGPAVHRQRRQSRVRRLSASRRSTSSASATT